MSGQSRFQKAELQEEAAESVHVDSSTRSRGGVLRNHSRGTSSHWYTARDEEVQRQYALPEAIDWRDHEGVDYVGPVKNQVFFSRGFSALALHRPLMIVSTSVHVCRCVGVRDRSACVMEQGKCGSCYGVAISYEAEARRRIQTKDHAPQISVQHMMSCSIANQARVFLFLPSLPPSRSFLYPFPFESSVEPVLSGQFRGATAAILTCSPSSATSLALFPSRVFPTRFDSVNCGGVVDS